MEGSRQSFRRRPQTEVSNEREEFKTKKISNKDSFDHLKESFAESLPKKNTSTFPTFHSLLKALSKARSLICLSKNLISCIFHIHPKRPKRPISLKSFPPDTSLFLQVSRFFQVSEMFLVRANFSQQYKRGEEEGASSRGVCPDDDSHP
jgi:hypothetical protein